MNEEAVVRRRLKILPVLAFAFASLAGPVAMAESPAPSGSTCFFARNWEAWNSPSPTVIYFRIGAAQILRLDLVTGSNQLKYRDSHLINRDHTHPWICNPKDLDLLVSDQTGIIKEPLFVKTITRLTPEEAAAIPSKYYP
jgi:hypothetical protein